MQITTAHKGTDFNAVASVPAAKILYPEAVAVLPKSLNPNVRAFLSIHKDLQECIRSSAMMVQTEVAPAGHTGKNHASVCLNKAPRHRKRTGYSVVHNKPESFAPWFEGG